MKKYFKECKTAEELKKVYRTLAKQLHPDLGGDEEEFKIMQTEYEEAWERLKAVHFNKEGEQYTKETNEKASEFMDLIEKLIKLQGVETEICGSWIWCSGNTKPHKKLFKKLGFRWSGNKLAWYFHREPYRKSSKRILSMDEIRDFWGSEKFESEDEKQLAGC